MLDGLYGTFAKRQITWRVGAAGSWGGRKQEWGGMDFWFAGFGGGTPAAARGLARELESSDRTASDKTAAAANQCVWPATLPPSSLPIFAAEANTCAVT